MPRKFTPEEERRITEALRDAGRSIMGKRGVRRTSIDELARAGGISKGSFYRFFTSKEALALQLLAEWERGFHARIEERFRRHRPRGISGTATVLEQVLLEDFPQRLAESGMQALFDPEEISHLMRSADTRHARLMDEQDVRLFRKLNPWFGAAGLRPVEEEAVIIAGLRIVFQMGVELLRGAFGPEAGSRESVPLEPEHYRRAFFLLLEGFLTRSFRYERGDTV